MSTIFKKYISIVLAMCLVIALVALVACKDEKEPADTTPEVTAPANTTPTETAPTTTTPAETTPAETDPKQEDVFFD